MSFRSRASQTLPRISLPPLSRWQLRPRPFFRLLHALLDEEREVTLGHLADVASEQTSGLLILLLALPSLVPGLNVGAAPVGGTVIMAIGGQMAMGVARPYIPERIRRHTLHKGRVKEALARLEAMLERLGPSRPQRRALNPRWTGVLVVWTGFLLALPVLLPFANILPAAVLCLTGAALLEERPAWGWLGAACALGNTLYFAASAQLIVAGLLHGLRTLRHFLP